jgi:hypothetical protein
MRMNRLVLTSSSHLIDRDRDLALVLVLDDEHTIIDV